MRRDTKSFCKCDDDIQAGTFQATLQLADVGSMQTGAFGQFFLADFDFCSCFAEAFGESPPVSHAQSYQELPISINRLKYSATRRHKAVFAKIAAAGEKIYSLNQQNLKLELAAQIEF
jgi:hypothetical protein